MDLNVNNLSVDSNGRVSFSGVSSGIDFQAVVDSIVAAKRIPIDRLETEVSTNESKIAALGDLRTLMTSLKDSLSTLHGAVSVGSTTDSFEQKEAFATSARLDGATASSATNIIGVTVDNSAPVGSHTLEVLQTARAHKIATDEITSQTAAVGFTTGDKITIEGVEITFASGDTLQDVRDRINNANSGTSATGVSAAIVKVSDSENYLVLTKDATGSDITLAETSGTPLQDLGIFTAGSALKNELQTSRKAEMYADGILDQTNTLYESDFQTAATAAVGIGGAGTITFTRDSDSAPLGSIIYNDGDDLTAIAANITANITDVTATVVTDGAGVRLEITGVAGFSMSDTGTATADFGIDNKRRLIERDSNTVDDLFNGITLSLFQAEAGTTINLEIERNLNGIKTALSDFTESYNELRRFINDQRTLVQVENSDDETVQSGLLFSSEALEQADTQLSAIIGAGVGGVNSSFSVLAQIGIDFIPLGSESDPLDANTLEIDETTLDDALLNNVEDIRRLFSFDFTPSDPRVTLLGFDGNTNYNASGFTLNLQPAGGSNLLTYSETLDEATVWTPKDVTVSADVGATTAPDGSSTAEGIIANTTATSHLISNSASPVTVNSGDTYIYSTYVKAGASDGVRLFLNGPSGQGGTLGFDQAARADFDLTPGMGSVTVEGSGIDKATIEDVGDNWYRISIAATATDSQPAVVETYSLRGGAVSFAGDGATVDTYMWGSQLEVASANTTPITNYSQNRISAINTDAVTGADGGMTAEELVVDTDNNPHSIGNNAPIAVTAGETYTLTALVKDGPGTGGDAVRLQFGASQFAASSYIDFDLAGGTVDSAGAGLTVADGDIEDMGSGWYRVSVTATATGTGDGTFELFPKDGAAISFAGDGATANLYFENMRVVPNISPGSYVETTDTAATAFSGAGNIDGESGGTPDGSVTVDDSIITVNSGEAQGLQLFYSGITEPTSITLNYTVGVGAQMFFAIEDLLDENSGTIETEIDGLTDTNEISEDRITEMLARLEIQRRSLLERFIAMETAIATNNRILQSVQASADALSGSNS